MAYTPLVNARDWSTKKATRTQIAFICQECGVYYCRCMRASGVQDAVCASLKEWDWAALFFRRDRTRPRLLLPSSEKPDFPNPRISVLLFHPWDLFRIFLDFCNKISQVPPRCPFKLLQSATAILSISNWQTDDVDFRGGITCAQSVQQ